MIRRPPRSTLSSSSAASDVYKRQVHDIALHPKLAAALDRHDLQRTVLSHHDLGCAGVVGRLVGCREHGTLWLTAGTECRVELELEDGLESFGQLNNWCLIDSFELVVEPRSAGFAICVQSKNSKPLRLVAAPLNQSAGEQATVSRPPSDTRSFLQVQFMVLTKARVTGSPGEFGLVAVMLGDGVPELNLRPMQTCRLLCLDPSVYGVIRVQTGYECELWLDKSTGNLVIIPETLRRLELSREKAVLCSQGLEPVSPLSDVLVCRPNQLAGLVSFRCTLQGQELYDGDELVLDCRDLCTMDQAAVLCHKPKFPLRFLHGVPGATLEFRRLERFLSDKDQILFKVIDSTDIRVVHPSPLSPSTPSSHQPPFGLLHSLYSRDWIRFNVQQSIHCSAVAVLSIQAWLHCTTCHSGSPQSARCCHNPSRTVLLSATVLLQDGSARVEATLGQDHVLKVIRIPPRNLSLLKAALQNHDAPLVWTRPGDGTTRSPSKKTSVLHQCVVEAPLLGSMHTIFRPTRLLTKPRVKTKVQKISLDRSGSYETLASPRVMIQVLDVLNSNATQKSYMLLQQLNHK
eukprot:TRINITY_DN23609_c0_g1_i3.p1 TRINITY_DN23609_c0_g1~~TRINITY_DN23609_c0_g1_i3.p1  ORF type:complete len:573 (-),score=109.69 TRINITY_DN23609_c0_g1_i3:434-2152(-)